MQYLKMLKAAELPSPIPLMLTPPAARHDAPDAPRAAPQQLWDGEGALDCHGEAQELLQRDTTVQHPS